MAKSQQNILVIKLGALGDFIQALGPMAAIREYHKGAKITLLTTKPFEKFAREAGYFDEILLDERPKMYNVFGWLHLRKILNDRNFTRVYDLQNNDRTSLYFRLLAPRPEWVGVAAGASHRNTSPERTAGHAYDGHVQTLGLAGIRDVQIDRLEWMKADLSGFDLKAPYVLLVPGSAPSRPEKRWPAEHYARLAKMLVGWGFQPVLLGTKAEKETTEIIAGLCPEALDLTGKTDLFQIVAMARDSAGAIGNDTGPMHLIGATGTPSLVLFSRHSNPVRHAPKGEHVNVIRQDELADLPAEKVMEAFDAREKPSAVSGAGTMH